MAIAFGFQRFLHDIRYHRERFRQFLGIAFVILVSAAGEPKELLFFAGMVMVILGIAVRLWASGHIKKNKALATDGPYAYVRHPLYVGNITLGFGFAFASSLWWSLPLLIGILFALYPHAIRREDENLHSIFKEDWEQWRKETRALIPRLTPYRPGQRSNWSFRQSLRQNGEPLIALFLLFWLYFLFLRLH
ncbi:MAG: isoprenylcysteine carboxylmethyltransferase family protein [Deltaproteobacteria bacterium]|nr:MAG: isoprenylcysteine carboxylmethyltransferase family protein [Deltaproteobacteria bacterium]